jgi:hypothetical protein
MCDKKDANKKKLEGDQKGEISYQIKVHPLKLTG